MLNPAAFFPAAPFDSNTVLDGLVTLGLQRTLELRGLLDAARSVDLLATEDASAAVHAGRALLRFLAADVALAQPEPADHPLPPAAPLQPLQPLQPPSPEQEGAALDLADVTLHEQTSMEEQRASQPAPSERVWVMPAESVTATADTSFWHELASICWCPALLLSPGGEHLPWPDALRGGTAPPKLVRPASAAWLVSSCLRLLDAPDPPSALARRLGWTLPLPPAVLANQLCELGRRFARVPATDDALIAQLDTTVAQLYTAMSAALPASPTTPPSADLEVLRAILEDVPWVWVSDPASQHSPPLRYAPSEHTLRQSLSPNPSLSRRWETAS